MKIEHKVDQGSLQSCAESFVYGESRTGQLSGSVEVENVQIGADIPVGSVFEIESPRFPPFSDLHVVGVIFAYRGFRIWSIGNSEKQFS